MKECKYRAWVFDDEWGIHKMIYPTRITFFPDVVYAFFPDDDYEYQIKPEFLMQFTGLRDKNGVEIYEGDIVWDHVGWGTVKYDERYAAFKVSYFRPEDEVGRAKWFYDYSLKGERESIEVMGNIHEHPDLLEVSA